MQNTDKEDVYIGILILSPVIYTCTHNCVIKHYGVIEKILHIQYEYARIRLKNLQRKHQHVNVYVFDKVNIQLIHYS